MARRTEHEIVDRYIEAWVGDDSTALWDLLADAVLETNLGRPDRFLHTLHLLATHADVRVAHRIDADGRSLVVYECAARGHSAKVNEYIDLEADRISRVRQVCDVVGMRRVVPDLNDTAEASS